MHKLHVDITHLALLDFLILESSGCTHSGDSLDCAADTGSSGVIWGGTGVLLDALGVFLGVFLAGASVSLAIAGVFLAVTGIFLCVAEASSSGGLLFFDFHPVQVPSS